MKISNLNLTLLVCTLLITMQTIFIIIPSNFISLFNTTFRPFIFIALSILVYIMSPKDIRKTSINSLLSSIISVSIFGICMLILITLFGASRNVFTIHQSVILRSLWAVGTCVIAGDFIRFKLIRASRGKEREFVLNAITITLVYSQIFYIHMILGDNLDFLSLFFGYIFMPLVIGYVASYFSLNGSFVSVLLFSYVFSMKPYLSPFLPSLPPIVYYLIASGLAFVSATCFYILNNKPNNKQKMRIKRAARYTKKSFYELAFSTIIIVISTAFFLGFFTIYPIAIRTNSMEGTFERGSLVFVERVPPGLAFDMVGEGYIIHYVSPHNRNTTFTHRVVAFMTDYDGSRIFVTRGDAEIYSYSYVSEDEVIGIVRAFLPHAGFGALIFEQLFMSFR